MFLIQDNGDIHHAILVEVRTCDGTGLRPHDIIKMRVNKRSVSPSRNHGYGPPSAVAHDNIGNFVAGEVPHNYIMRPFFSGKVIQLGERAFTISHINAEAVLHRT